ncbi:MAG: M28 family peptidase [Candidatus Thorarchaeota archaeon]|nr:M28 family peptidase [Candidatus Thorarchaeota archaeon]
MKHLWPIIILGLILISPLNSTANEVPIDAASPSASPESVGNRIYGKNIAEELYQQLSSSTIESLVQKLTENGSRDVQELGDVNVGANMYLRNYIIQELYQKTRGKIEIEIIGDYKNVVGRLAGYLPGNNPVFVISAHYDAVPNSPGANSDGVGIAVMLELARIFSFYDWPLDIYFIAFNALYVYDLLSDSSVPVRRGSQEVAEEFVDREIDILTLYNIDSILVPNLALPRDEYIQIGYLEGATSQYHEGQYWGDLTRAISQNYGMGAFVPIASNSFFLWTGSDHYSFVAEGYTNIVCAFESGRSVDGNYLTSNDRWNNVEYDYILAQETGGTIAAILAYTMSRRYGEPNALVFEDTVRSGRIAYYYIPVTTPTSVNISVRWFGGPANFYLYDPNLNIIDSALYNHTSAWFPTDVFNTQVTSNGLYAFVIENAYYNSIGYEISMTFESDIDGNNVLDSQEYWLNQAYFNLDQDNDGLSDAEEIFLGTDVTLTDSDLDIMDDKYEVDWGFNPTDPADGSLDVDEDGLSNAQEYSVGTNPYSEDSDSDMIPDLWELENGLNPLINDAELDPDVDGKSNLQEYLDGTNPYALEYNSMQILLTISPIVVIAPIVVFLYIRRLKNSKE